MTSGPGIHSIAKTFIEHIACIKAKNKPDVIANIAARFRHHANALKQQHKFRDMLLQQRADRYITDNGRKKGVDNAIAT